MAKKDCEIWSNFVLFIFWPLKWPPNLNLTWSAQHNLGVPKLFDFMIFFIHTFFLPQICPSIFLTLSTIGTLWNYQNFVKSRRRPFEQSLFLFPVPLFFSWTCQHRSCKYTYIVYIETPLPRVERALPVEMREEVVPFPHHRQRPCLFWSEASRRHRPWEGEFRQQQTDRSRTVTTKKPLCLWLWCKERETTQRYTRG